MLQGKRHDHVLVQPRCLWPRGAKSGPAKTRFRRRRQLAAVEGTFAVIVGADEDNECRRDPTDVRHLLRTPLRTFKKFGAVVWRAPTCRGVFLNPPSFRSAATWD